MQIVTTPRRRSVVAQLPQTLFNGPASLEFLTRASGGEVKQVLIQLITIALFGALPLDRRELQATPVHFLAKGARPVAWPYRP